MSHFAEIDSNGNVLRVITAEQSFIESGAVGDPASWVQTSYNTRGGVHYDSVTNQPDGEVPMRKNFAGIGMIYDKTRDAFIPPQPFPSWTLNESTCLWDAPTPKPGFDYYWDEPTLTWKQYGY